MRLEYRLNQIIAAHCVNYGVDHIFFRDSSSLTVVIEIAADNRLNNLYLHINKIIIHEQVLHSASLQVRELYQQMKEVAFKFVKYVALAHSDEEDTTLSKYIERITSSNTTRYKCVLDKLSIAEYVIIAA